MKILYLITKSNWGGAQRHVYDLATSMKERGHTPVVALGGEGILRKRLEDAGIKTHSIPNLGRDISISKEISSLKEIFSIIKRERPDVMHLHSPKAAGLGAIAAKILGVKKIIYTVHGWAFNEDRPLYQKALIAVASWANMALVDKTILLSERELNQSMKFPFVDKKLILIRPGMKPPIFISINGAKQALAQILGLSVPDILKKTIIGTVAELHPNKGIKYLIEAMEKVSKDHPETISVIIGGGDQFHNIGEAIKKNGLENNVRLIGYLENAAEYIKAFNIFTLPSVKEGLPYVLIEAGYASLPIVATTVGGIPEMIEDMGSGVLVQPKNSNELAHAISYLVEHPVMAKKYGSYLREQVTQKYSLERMVNEVEGLYKAQQ